MEEVASFYARVLLHGEDPAAVRADVHALKQQRQTIRYCFNEDERSGYPSESVMQWVENPTVCIILFLW